LLAMMALVMGCSVEAPIFGAAPPLATPEQHQVLVFVGDTGEASTHQAQVLETIRATCAARSCTGIVLLGDLLYLRGPTSDSDPRLDALIGVYGTIAPTYLVLGNHDYGRGRDRTAVEHLTRWAQRTPAVHLPGQAYTVDLGIGTLAVVDTNRVFQYGDEGQGPWLDEALTPPGWRIVAGHHPFRSNGRHGNAGAYEGWAHIPWLSGNSVATFVNDHICGAADLYVSGHDHNLQVLNECGTTLVVSGSGAKVTALVDRGNTPAFASDEPGFVLLDLTETAGTLTVVGARGASLFETTL
jgi:tartrate-resistant acid phosphatase type 5